MLSHRLAIRLPQRTARRSRDSDAVRSVARRQPVKRPEPSRARQLNGDPRRCPSRSADHHAGHPDHPGRRQPDDRPDSPCSGHRIYRGPQFFDTRGRFVLGVGFIAPATPAATVTDDSTATTTTDPVSTITASDPAPAVDPTPAASVTSVVETVAAALGQPDLPAFEPSVVAPVVVTAVPMTVPLASVTVAPPGILQWFALLTWFQFQC